MMKQFIFILSVLSSFTHLLSQEKESTLTGQVSFISTQNIYVKFRSALGISAGDTLFKASGSGIVPVLVVTAVSSTSCVGTKIGPEVLAVGEPVMARKRNPAKTEEKIIETHEISIGKIDPDSAVSGKTNVKEFKQKIRGSISAIAYTDINSFSSDNLQRFRYTFSLDARHIANSRISAESYISFRHREGDWMEVKANVFNALKIYNLNVRYDLNNTTQISLGRRINHKISSIGAMDGLQAEKTIGKISLGAVLGTRPDYSNYSFNSSLFQYGGYVAFANKKGNGYSESSLAFMQQMNHSKTDRRFIYFQHSNSLVHNLNFFGTLEVDLYEMNYDSAHILQRKTTFNPTGMFLSLRYKPAKNLTISGSYDARKNVVYYETYKTFIDRVLDNEMRQGLRLQANYRITGNMMFGLQSGYRFMKSDPKPSKNLYGYMTYTRIPGIGASATLSATFLEASYLSGKIMGISLSREYLKGKIQTGLAYRYVDYKLSENLSDILQHIGEISLSCQFLSRFSLSMNYEGTFERHLKFHRLYTQIRMRF